MNSVSQGVQGDPNEQCINDVFDDILFSEERVITESYTRGYSLGSAEDTIEGYHLGYHKGAEVGSELGYYEAFCEHYLKESTDGNISKKAVKNLEALQKSLNEFPHSNSDTIDLFALIEKIRGLYKKICIQLKIKSDFKKEGLQF
ncbi:protein LTO1 homolog isoform X2 [Sitophilus oryzae]|uniref:Protein LTO1 homolog isoform X2 n=1 Tax=Sitophilus oryzae TaxID=7048 RepID=A0A6J2YNR9_SITOR|nr:protein LTO1 homolog isoform X2 [Sitophilus oryzae]